MKMSVGVGSSTTGHHNNNNGAASEKSELDKLDDTLDLLAHISLTLRTSTSSTALSNGLQRRRRSGQRSSGRGDRSPSPLCSETLPRNHTETSHDHGFTSYANDQSHYATVVRTPRRNSAGKVTKLTRHRPHLRGKPNRPGMGRGVQGSPRSSVNAHGSSNGSVPGAGMYPRGMPAVPPKSKIMTPEELTNHEAQEKLRMKQMEEAMLQQRLDQQQKQAEENARWLQQEEQMLFTSLQNPDKTATNGDDQGLARGRGSSNSLTDMQAPPPPTVAPSKPPRKSSRPKDEPSGPPQTKLEEVKTAPTMQLNREDDRVYKDTMEVVKAVLGMNQITMEAKPEDLFASVKGVGAALKQLCTSLEEALPSLPEDFHREIDMAQKTTNKDLSQVINQLKLVQRFYTTTQVVDYKKCLMAANQVLAIDAKNLLDVVDRARIRKIQNAQEAEARSRSTAAAFEHEDSYPADVS